jgi:hypothetical protein
VRRAFSDGFILVRSMSLEPRMHRQRVAILFIAAVAAVLHVLPLGKVPLIWTLDGIARARTVAWGLCGLAAALAVFGRHRRKMRLPLRIAGFAAVGVAIALGLFRIVVLSPRSLPTFADDDPGAASYYQKVCDAGAMNACAALGICYWTGTCGVAKNPSRGLDLFQKACDGGDMSACGQLGVCYESGGCGLTKSSERAVAYYERACDGGEMGMCNNLGVCYFKGECGLGKDDARAVELYTKACRGGDSGACHNLDLVKRP